MEEQNTNSGISTDDLIVGYDPTGKERNEIINEITDAFISDLSVDAFSSFQEMANSLESIINDALRQYNASVGKNGTKYRLIDGLPNDIIAELMSVAYHIRKIITYGTEEKDNNWVLGVYREYGSKSGLYDTSESELYRRAREFNRRITKHDFHEIMNVLSILVPAETRCMEENLIPLNNGIFDYKLKVLNPFSEEKIFLSKSPIDFNPSARNVVIHNADDGTDWDIESWIANLCESKYSEDDMASFLWSVIGSFLRPLTPFGKALFSYSSCGCSGKGCFSTLLRNLVGASNCASIPFEKFDDRFALSQLLEGAQAIVVDENSVGSFLEAAGNFKNCVTQDCLDIEVKHKNSVRMSFMGRIYMCFNSIVKAKDSSDSFYRRIIWLEFNHNFIEEGERKYIKTDYLGRKEVLEYCVYKTLVLMDDYYSYDVPRACQDNIELVKSFNEPVKVFWETFREEISYNMAPFGFLYELYKAFMHMDCPNGRPVSKISFKQQLLEYVAKDDLWTYEEDKRYRKNGRYDFPEKLIGEYDLSEWKNWHYTGNDPDTICTQDHKDNQQGIIKVAFLNNSLNEEE